MGTAETRDLADCAPQVVVVSGLSGAGKSTALHALEDLGYFCVDNIPTPVVSTTLQACRADGVCRIALGIDVRLRSFLEGFGTAIDEIAADSEAKLSVVFLDASDTALLSRFSATRRPHPLSTAQEGREREAHAVLDGIVYERERLAKVRARATHIIDTTSLTVHDLRRRTGDLFGQGVVKTSGMRVRVLTFGFKYGPPVDADIMLDVRFLPNPYFDENLKHLTGMDEPVFRFVTAIDDTQKFLALARNLVAFCVPRCEAEGKAYLTIAVGCTGGRHRSVVVGIELARELHELFAIPVHLVHRDAHRDSPVDGVKITDTIGGGARGLGRGSG